MQSFKHELQAYIYLIFVKKNKKTDWINYKKIRQFISPIATLEVVFTVTSSH